jgi:hypothetical protein
MKRVLRAAGLLVLVAAAAAQVQETRRISAVPWLAPRAMQRRELVSMSNGVPHAEPRAGGGSCLFLPSLLVVRPCVGEFARAASFSLALSTYMRI